PPYPPACVFPPPEFPAPEFPPCPAYSPPRSPPRSPPPLLGDPGRTVSGAPARPELFDSTYAGLLTKPLCSTAGEILPKFPIDPRGTPNPAELFRNTKPCSPISFEVAIGVWFANAS